MKHQYLTIYAVALFLFFVACEGGKTPTDTKDEKKDPKPLVLEIRPNSEEIKDQFRTGEIVNQLGFTHENIAHYIVHTYSFIEGNHEMYVYHYTKDEIESFTRKSVHSSVILNCEFDLINEHILESVQATDRDNDGVLEITSMYKLDCVSDVSPKNLHLVMMEGDTKYVLKGYTEVMGEGGNFEASENFNSNKKLLDFATEVWDAHKKEEF